MRCPNCLIDLPFERDEYRCKECGFCGHKHDGFINEIWAILSVDDTGEGIMVAQHSIGSLAMVAGKKEMVESMRKQAKRLAVAMKSKLRLVKFSTKEILEEYE